MTVEELIAELTRLVREEDVAPMSEIFVAHQPHWPLALKVTNLSWPEQRDMNRDGPEEYPKDSRIYIAVDSADWGENPYAPSESWE